MSFSFSLFFFLIFFSSYSGAKLAKGLHIFINILFLIAGAGLIGVGAFVLATNGAVLTSGLSNLAPIAILVMCCGGVIFFISLIGCIGSCRESRCMLNFYSFLLILFIAAEISLAVYSFVHRGQVVNSLTQQAWNALPPATQEQIEADLKCCGWNHTVFGSGGPCGSNPPITSVTCEAVVIQFVHNSFFILAMVSLGVATIQLFGLVISCILAASIASSHREHDREKLLNEAREANRLPPSYPVHTVHYQTVPNQGYGYVQKY